MTRRLCSAGRPGNSFEHCVNYVASAVEDKACLESRINKIGEKGKIAIADTRSIVIVCRRSEYHDEEIKAKMSTGYHRPSTVMRVSMKSGGAIFCSPPAASLYFARSSGGMSTCKTASADSVVPCQPNSREDEK
jgi:hypothetical protein